MSLSLKPLLLVLIGLAVGSTAVASDAPWTYTTAVRVAVDASGHAKVLHFSRDIPDRLIPPTTAKIESWEFEPAKRDGTAVTSETVLYVRYDVREVDKGFSFEVAGVDVGAGIVQSKMPAYPEGAIRRRIAGDVLLKVEIDDEGRPTQVVDVSDKKLPYLSAAAVNAVQRWRFAAQRVDGIAIHEPLFVPIAFKLLESNQQPTILKKNERTTDALVPPQSEQWVGSKEPVVKLLTRLQP
jgi:TonB family protein